MRKFVYIILSFILLSVIPLTVNAQQPSQCVNKRVVTDPSWATGAAIINPDGVDGFYEYELWKDGRFAVGFATGIKANDLLDLNIADLAPEPGVYVLRVCGVGETPKPVVDRVYLPVSK